MQNDANISVRFLQKMVLVLLYKEHTNAEETHQCWRNKAQSIKSSDQTHTNIRLNYEQELFILHKEE